MPDTVYEDIYEKAARDLADFTEPDLSDFSDDDIDIAMTRAFTAAGARPGWLGRLRTAIEEASDGNVTLEDADPEEFPRAFKGLGVSYQQLLRKSGVGERKQFLTIGQFEHPFRFVRGAGHPLSPPSPSPSLKEAIEESLRDIITEALRRPRR